MLTEQNKYSLRTRWDDVKKSLKEKIEEMRDQKYSNSTKVYQLVQREIHATASTSRESTGNFTIEAKILACEDGKQDELKPYTKIYTTSIEEEKDILGIPVWAIYEGFPIERLCNGKPVGKSVALVAKKHFYRSARAFANERGYEILTELKKFTQDENHHINK